jgi:hypothetical protein
LFKGVESPEALKKKAKQTFDKVTALTADTFEANSKLGANSGQRIISIL